MQEAPSVLGKGWSFPPRFGEGGAYLEMTSEEENVLESLRIILSTEKGERINNLSFGNDVYKHLFEGLNNTLLNNLKESLRTAIIQNEPRIILEDIKTSINDDNREVLLLEVKYTVRNTNTRYNLVYPYYLLEADNKDKLVHSN